MHTVAYSKAKMKVCKSALQCRKYGKHVNQKVVLEFIIGVCVFPVFPVLLKRESPVCEEGKHLRGQKSVKVIQRYRLWLSKHLYRMTVSAGLLLPYFDLLCCQPGSCESSSQYQSLQEDRVTLAGAGHAWSIRFTTHHQYWKYWVWCFSFSLV